MERIKAALEKARAEKAKQEGYLIVL